MELFDYIVFRWKMWTALLLGGLVAILVVGLNTGASGYSAQAELLVRPSSAESSTYASDPDRYIETELALLYTPYNMARQAEGSGMEPDELADALSTSHEPGSESVTFSVNAPTESGAVQAVNVVAESFIEAAAERSGPDEAKTDALAQEIRDVRGKLTKATNRIQRATDRFLTNNPDAGTPSPSRVAPEAALQQSLLSSQLSQLSASFTELELEAATATTRSQLLQTADSAEEVGGWSLTTLLAAVVGWILLLLTAAAAGLALSSRIIGPARWSQALAGSSFPAALPVRSRTEAAREHTVRRVATALEAVAPGTAAPDTTDADQPIEVVYEPTNTERVQERAAYLLDGLKEQGYVLRERDAFTQTAPSRTLLVVDLNSARVDDARALQEYPPSQQQRTVPVLV